jgi:DNA-binding MarR family transcriptional regulator
MASDFSALIASVHEAMASRLEPQLEELGVSWTSFQLLAAVHGAEGKIAQAEIAHRLGVAPATLSESVQGHLKHGTLIQVGSEIDRRVKHLELTKFGKEKFAEIFRLVAATEKEMLTGIPAAERKAVEKVLTRVVQNLESPGTKPLR